ncbi:hypothetical protein WKW49_14480 [Teredinibacter turnerae]
MDDNWSDVDKKFEANIRITKRGSDIDVRTTNNFTSKETEEINNKVINYVKNHYIKSGHIKTEEEKITFGAFDNSERILFLWSLTGNISDGEITFERITDIDIHPDTSKTFPKDLNIEWMANNISRVHLTGDQLHQTFFIKDQKCYPYLILWKMQVQYMFKTKSAEGSCNVSFEFQNYSKSKKDSAELVISIDSISLAKGYKHLNKKRIETDILQRLDDLKTSSFLTHLESSKS